jgi:hypothetical protein
MPFSKAEEKSRKAFGKAVAAELKKRAKSSGWKFSQGWLFRQQGEWFIDARPAVWVIEPRTTFDLFAKPMAIDPVFWDIVDTPDNNDTPLSFRLFGAWTVSTPAITSTDLRESSDAAALAVEILAVAERELDAASPELSLERFLQRAGAVRPGRSGSAWISALVCGLALQGRRDEIRELCFAAQARDEGGGYSVGSKSFVDLTLEWLTRTEPVRH